VFNFINGGLIFACSYFFESTNWFEHAKGNIQKMGNFLGRKTIKYK